MDAEKTIDVDAEEIIDVETVEEAVEEVVEEEKYPWAHNGASVWFEPGEGCGSWKGTIDESEGGEKGRR